MAWLTALSPAVSETKLRELAQGIAERCQAAVQARVSRHIGQLVLAEARGYVRARGNSVIAREVALLIEAQPKLEASREQLHRMASEAAIRQVVWQELRQRKGQVHPSQGQPHRRAA